MAVATTAVGFAFGLWAYNKFIVGKAMVSKGVVPSATTNGSAMAMPTASSSADDGL